MAIVNLREQMQQVENLLAGKMGPATTLKATTTLLIASCKDPLMKQAISDVILSTPHKEAFPRLQEIIYFSRYSTRLDISIMKAESALTKSNNGNTALAEEDKIDFKEFAQIHDLAKLHTTLSQLAKSVIDQNPELQTFCQQVKRSHDVISVCKSFSLAKNNDITLFLPYEGVAKATTADWMMALLAKLVRVNPPAPHAEHIPSVR